MVQRHACFDLRRPLRRAAVFFAALVVVLQGLASALLAAEGPLHEHRPAVSARAAGSLPLVDFRRALSPLARTVEAHAHPAGEAARHHHASDDDTVVALADPVAEAAADAAADDARAVPPAFLPLPSDAKALAVPAAGPPARRPDADRWRSVAATPPERPPRLG